MPESGLVLLVDVLEYSDFLQSFQIELPFGLGGGDDGLLRVGLIFVLNRALFDLFGFLVGQLFYIHLVFA